MSIDSKIKNNKQKIDQLTIEIEMINKYLAPLEDLNIYGSVIANKFISLDIKNFEQIKQVIDIYPPLENNKLSFASKEDKPTISPFLININNYTFSEPSKVTLRYKSEIPVWISIPIELLNQNYIDISFITNPSYTGKYPERNGSSQLKLKNISAQAYASSDYLIHFTHYAKNEDDLKHMSKLLGFEVKDLKC